MPSDMYCVIGAEYKQFVSFAIAVFEIEMLAVSLRIYQLLFVLLCLSFVNIYSAQQSDGK